MVERLTVLSPARNARRRAVPRFLRFLEGFRPMGSSVFSMMQAATLPAKFWQAWPASAYKSPMCNSVAGVLSLLTDASD